MRVRPEYLEHIRLKNWVYSLFEPCQVLYHDGFLDKVPTPAIRLDAGFLSPDVIAWSELVTLVLEAKSGKPNPEEDYDRAKKYLQIPIGSLEMCLGRPIKRVEAVLVYFEEKLKQANLREELFNKIVLEPKIAVWALDRMAGTIRLVYGTHGSATLTNRLKSRIPVDLLVPKTIFLQANSPLQLICREVFWRLLQRAYQYRKKFFSLEDARDVLKDQVYAYSDNEEDNKIKKVVRIGERSNLCVPTDRPNIWKLNLYLRRPDKYLESLNKLIAQKPLEEYLMPPVEEKPDQKGL